MEKLRSNSLSVSSLFHLEYGYHMIKSFNIVFFFSALAFGCSDTSEQVSNEEHEDIHNSTAEALSTQPNPLVGKSLFEICESTGLSLIRFSYAERQKKTECCGNKMSRKNKQILGCKFNWPTKNVPHCKIYELMRNEIYAYHGRPFTDDIWKKYFD